MRKIVRRSVGSLDLTKVLSESLETVVLAQRLHVRMLGGSIPVRRSRAGITIADASAFAVRALWRLRGGSGRRVPLPRRVIA